MGRQKAAEPASERAPVERLADQCGHLVTGRPDLCPCRRMVDQETGSIGGTDEELMDRARRLGVDPGAYLAGVRAAERNAEEVR